MSVNIDGMFLMAQSVGRQLLHQGEGGSVIQTASIYGLVGPDSRIYEDSEYLGGPINTPAVYSASKAAVVGLTKWLATHWAKSGVRVNCLVPGGVSSGQNSSFSDHIPNVCPWGVWLSLMKWFLHFCTWRLMLPATLPGRSYQLMVGGQAGDPSVNESTPLRR